MYQPLESFSKSWIFKRNDPKVEKQDLDQIGLLNEQRASQIWRDYISSDQLHPDHFTGQDWLASESAKASLEKVQWERTWDSEQPELPQDVLEHFVNWGDDTKVFFCCHNELVFELSWGVFKRTWKAFLFLDNGPILVGKKKKQAIQFHSNGWADLLLRVS